MIYIEQLRLLRARDLLNGQPD